MATVLMGLEFIVYTIVSLLSLGAFFVGCTNLVWGGVVEFIFAVGLAVVVGWIGRAVGGLLFAAGAAATGSGEE